MSNRAGNIYLLFLVHSILVWYIMLAVDYFAYTKYFGAKTEVPSAGPGGISGQTEDARRLATMGSSLPDLMSRKASRLSGLHTDGSTGVLH